MLPLSTAEKPPEEVPGGNKLFLVLSVRSIQMTEAFEGLVPKGTRSVALFLVNRRRPASDLRRDEGYIFQAALEVRTDVPLQPRPNLRGVETDGQG